MHYIKFFIVFALLPCLMESCGGQGGVGGRPGLTAVIRFAAIKLFAVSYGCNEVFNLSIVSSLCCMTLLFALFYISRSACSIGNTID